MTGTGRIRWEPTKYGGWTGHVGTLESWIFQIWKPDPDYDREWRLDSATPGQFAWHLTGEPEALKKGAEAWLAEFVSSLGAAFPEEPGESAAFQLGEARAVLARWDAEQGGEFVISREKVLADQVRALLAIVDQEAAVKAAGQQEDKTGG